MRSNKNHLRFLTILAAATATLPAIRLNAAMTPQPARTSIPGNSNTNQYTTFSISGSTALRGFTTSTGFTFLPSNSTIFLSSGTYTAPGSGVADQLAPTSPTTLGSGSLSTDVPALRVEWHEQGSVEGILELVTDQIGTPTGTPSSLVSRAPTVSNPIWINRGTVSGDAGTTTDPSGANSNGWTYGATGTSTGQSSVQMAISDVKPIQGFSVAGVGTYNAAPGASGYGKGNPLLTAVAGDTAGLGKAGSLQQLTDVSNLNITSSAGPWQTAGLNNLQTNTVAITATTFAANPGTGLSNLSTTDAQWLQLTGRLKNGAAFNMATRDVNSGTRNTAALNTGIDPSWAVGVNDGGSGLVTTDAAAADSQVQINRFTPTTVADGTSIVNATMRFSGKTAGGLLRSTVLNSRLGIGTLSLPDALGTAGNLNTGGAYTGSTPLRVLTLDNVSPTAATITDGTYKIWQQEQYVTVKNTPDSLSGDSAAQWAATTDLQTGIKGDVANASSIQTANVSSGTIYFGPSGTSTAFGGYVKGQTLVGGFPSGTTVTDINYNADGSINHVQTSDTTTTNSALTYSVHGGDVANIRNNVLNSVVVAGSNIGFSDTINPGDQLISNGYILPQLEGKQKSYDGQTVSNASAYDINTNPNGYNSSLHDQFVTSAIALKNSAPAPTITSPTGSTGGYYGQAVRGAGVGQTGVPASSPVPLTNGNIGITTSNYLFGNFAGNGIRDYQSFQYGLAAAKALYNSGAGVDAFDTTAATNLAAADNGTPLTDTQLDNNGISAFTGTLSLSSKIGLGSTFTGQRGPSSGSKTAYTVAATTAAGVSKGDLIVMGDYNGDGRFDGRDIYSMAVGTALSDGYGQNSLNSLADINTGVSRKNDALDFAQTNTSNAHYNTSSGFSVADNADGFLRQSARAILSSSAVGPTTPATPSGATFLYSTSVTDPMTMVVTNSSFFTYDPTGSNAFNKTDVNQDGVVDFNDAILVDKFATQSYQNVNNVLGAAEQAPITGTTKLANLVLVQQVDNEAQIGAADLAVANSALTGTGTTNWYNYSLAKTGTGTINWNRTGGTVNVTSGSAFNVSAGTVHVTSAIDPFTDSSVSTLSSDTTKSVAITVATGSTLQYTGAATGVQIDRVGGLTVGGTVKLDAVAGNRTLLITGPLTGTASGLTLGGGNVDIGSNEMIVHNGSLGTVNQATGVATPGSITAAFLAGKIMSSSTPGSPLTTIGIISGSDAANGSGGTPALDGVLTSAGDVLIKYTYFGDANLDGGVDGSDYTKIDAGFNGNKTGWANGDFNYDGHVDGSDYTLIDNAFNTQGGSLGTSTVAQIANSTAQLASSSALVAASSAQLAGGSTTAVPEPTTLGLLSIGAVGLIARRRQRN